MGPLRVGKIVIEKFNLQNETTETYTKKVPSQEKTKILIDKNSIMSQIILTSHVMVQKEGT